MLIEYIELYIKNYSDINVPVAENYNINKLFNHLIVSKSILYIENCKIDNIKDFGIILREHRKRLSITRLDILTETGLSFNTINKIESGKNYTKKTLKKYITLFPSLNYKIIHS